MPQKKLTDPERKRRKAVIDKAYRLKKKAERIAAARSPRGEAHAAAAEAGGLGKEQRSGRETPVGNRQGGKWYSARRAMGYGAPDTPTISLMRGQLFQLQDCINDDRLVGGGEGGIGYCELLTKEQVRDALPCRECGERFTMAGLLEKHGQKVHATAPTLRLPPPPTRRPGERMIHFQKRFDEHMVMVERRKDIAEARGLKDDDRDAPLILENTAASRGVSAPA